MIGVKLEGRLGNQLFQYAFALNLARKTRQQFYIDQEKFTFDGRRYFKLPSFGKYKNRVNLEISRRFLNCSINIENQSESPSDNLNNFDYHNVLFSGFFQSLEYFKESEAQVKREFELSPASKIQFENKYSEIFVKEKIIGIHVRKTDIVTLGILEGNPVDASLSRQYYLQCLNKIENVNDYKIVFATDDVEWVKLNFGNLTNAIINNDSEIVDFQKLLNADILILSNSTFCWWAAYLNTNKDLKVFAPKYWFGNHKGCLYPPHIFNGLKWTLI